MKKDLIQEYTARITQSNRSQLVVVVYDAMIDYIKSGIEYFESGNETEFISEMKNAQNLLADLMRALDYKYAISNQLFNLYLFWNKQISTAIVKKSTETLDGLEGMMRKMRNSFEKVSSEDKSEPIMKNTQKVYAGMTYGRESISEIADIDANRGFMA